MDRSGRARRHPASRRTRHLKLFLDTSALIAASGSSVGAARRIIELAPANGWDLIATPYVLWEIGRNIVKFPLPAQAEWHAIRPCLLIRPDVLSSDRLIVFTKTKDRPVLLSASAWADVLITHDTGDFHRRLGTSFYGLKIRTPLEFLTEQHRTSALVLP